MKRIIWTFALAVTTIGLLISVSAHAAEFEIGQRVIVNYIGLQSAVIEDLSVGGDVKTSAGSIWIKLEKVRKYQSVDGVNVDGVVISKGDSVIVKYIGLQSATVEDVNFDGLVKTTAGSFWLEPTTMRKARPISSFTRRNLFERVRGLPGETFRVGETVMVEYIGTNSATIEAIDASGLVKTSAGTMWVEETKIRKK